MEESLPFSRIGSHSAKTRGSFLLNIEGNLDDDSFPLRLLYLRATLYPENTIRIRWDREIRYVLLYTETTILLIWPQLSKNFPILLPLLRRNSRIRALGTNSTDLEVARSIVLSLPSLDTLYFGGNATEGARSLLRVTGNITRFSLLPPEYGGSLFFPRRVIGILSRDVLRTVQEVEKLVYPLKTANFLLRRMPLRSLLVSVNIPLRAPPCVTGEIRYLPITEELLSPSDKDMISDLRRKYPHVTLTPVIEA